MGIKGISMLRNLSPLCAYTAYETAAGATARRRGDIKRSYTDGVRGTDMGMVSETRDQRGREKVWQ